MSSDELIEVKPEFMGFHNGDYPGAFPPKVAERIRMIAASPCLHFFSGSSKIGDERIDLTHPNATRNMDVFDFCQSDNRDWEFLVLDPPYALSDRNVERMGYAKHDTWLWSSKTRRDILEDYIFAHIRQILWFDTVSPCPRGFYRERTWLYIKGGYTSIRALTWLKRKGERLQ